MMNSIPDLHSQQPTIKIPIHYIGHKDVIRIVDIKDYPTSAYVTIDIGVGLRPTQRGAHMSRLIDCLPFNSQWQTLGNYVMSSFLSLVRVTPNASRWQIDAKATFLINVTGGVKPLQEYYSIVKEDQESPVISRGCGLKICLACPQGQCMIAAKHNGNDNTSMFPTHNQVCDIKVIISSTEHIANSLKWRDVYRIVEAHASGPVRERHKRATEAETIEMIHANCRFAEDSLRQITSELRQEYPEAYEIIAEVVNYESIFEYPLYCKVCL